MKINPCYDCSSRHAKCHSECDMYLNWKNEYDQYKQKVDKAKFLENEMRNYEITTSIKGKKRFHKY